MPQPNDAPIVIRADTSGFEAAMRDIGASTERFGRIFAATMRQAVLSGRDLDDTLRSIALRFADMALGQALQPVENAFSSFVGSVFSGLARDAGSAFARGTGAAPTVTMNVATPDVDGFARSQGQIAAMLARAVGYGWRSL